MFSLLFLLHNSTLWRIAEISQFLSDEALTVLLKDDKESICTAKTKQYHGKLSVHLIIVVSSDPLDASANVS